jgi:HK97 family phage prohead protease
MAKQNERKDFKVTIKSVDDEGVFSGVLSVYGVVDLGGDQVEKGAFTKTLQESGAEIPCLWQHSQPIGSLKVFDGADGLEVQGRLCLEVQQAREALALMKARVVKGLSIGYRTIKSKVENGIRHLTEIALMEGSVVTFPMMPLAQVTDVKSAEEKGDFLTELDRAQVLAMRSMMIASLWNALDSIIWEGDALVADRITASDESIGQFHQAYISFLPKYFALWDEKSQPTEEQKAGRTISSATESKIREAIEVLTALLEPEADGTKPDEGKAADAKSAGVAKQDGTQPEPQDAEIHSLLKKFKL